MACDSDRHETSTGDCTNAVGASVVFEDAYCIVMVACNSEMYEARARDNGTTGEEGLEQAAVCRTRILAHVCWRDEGYTAVGAEDLIQNAVIGSGGSVESVACGGRCDEAGM